MLSLGEATDHALATIASILDRSEARREAEKPPTLVPEKPPTPVPTAADGYTKVGPGPIAALRFKWIVRRAANDEYFVDEMIGENPIGTVGGPLAGEEAVKLVDDREAEARQRFEQLRSEMIGRATNADLALKTAES